MLPRRFPRDVLPAYSSPGLSCFPFLKRKKPPPPPQKKFRATAKPQLPPSSKLSVYPSIPSHLILSLYPLKQHLKPPTPLPARSTRPSLLIQSSNPPAQRSKLPPCPAHTTFPWPIHRWKTEHQYSLRASPRTQQPKGKEEKKNHST